MAKRKNLQAEANTIDTVEEKPEVKRKTVKPKPEKLNLKCQMLK